MVKAWRAVELALERDGHLLLDLLRRQAGRLRDHLRGGVGDVGIGVDRELAPGVVAVDGEEDADHRHHQVLAQGEADDRVNH
jgi:hypothetical protein